MGCKLQKHLLSLMYALFQTNVMEDVSIGVGSYMYC